MAFGADSDMKGDRGMLKSPACVSAEIEFEEAPPSETAYPWPIWRPLLAVVLLSLLIRTYDLDRIVSKPWYDAVSHRWPMEHIEPLLSLYRFGIYPPWVLGGVGGIVAVFGRGIWPKAAEPRLKIIRTGGLFLVLMLIIGPGLIVESGFKSFWGRPRPRDCDDFGGSMAFKAVGEWNSRSFPNSSFPSGHASDAFFLMGPGFLFNPRQSYRSRIWFLGGLGYGCVMGLTRIIQGGHFLSDILWAGLIVYLVGAILARLMVRYT